MHGRSLPEACYIVLRHAAIRTAIEGPGREPGTFVSCRAVLSQRYLVHRRALVAASGTRMAITTATVRFISAKAAWVPSGRVIANGTSTASAISAPLRAPKKARGRGAKCSIALYRPAAAIAIPAA